MIFETDLKRLAAILFIVVVLFNFYGYNLVIDYAQNQKDREFASLLDNNRYNENDLVYVKLPVNLPYYGNSKNYEKVSGSVEVNGVEYKYVKRRVYNDTIELACLPNTNKQTLQSARINYFNLSNDLQTNHNGKKTSLTIKSVSLDFCNKLISYNLPDLAKTNKSYHTSLLNNLPDLFLPVQAQPPESVHYIG